jgi:hypothetical protein
MLLYKDYFSSDTSLSSSSSSLPYSPISNGIVYDIILLPSAYSLPNKKEQYTSSINWFDKKLVS